MSANEQNAVNQYNLLRQKALKVCATLARLPAVGDSWTHYFNKAFKYFSMLWSLQQQQRTVLSAHELQRYHIGMLADYIAQLYTQFYLRTGNLKPLNEACTFYNAIRSRSYYSSAIEGNAKIFQALLDFYAHYILVCFFTEDKRLLETLNIEFADMLSTQSQSKVDFIQQFTLLKNELSAFRSVFDSITVTQDNEPIVTDLLHSRVRPSEIGKYLNVHKENLSTNKGESVSQPKIKLHSGFIVCNNPQQVKYSELTIEGLRMMFSLEFEVGKSNVGMHPINPSKCVMYRSTVSQLLANLSINSSSAPQNKALFLYINALFDENCKGLRFESEDETETVKSASSVLYFTDLIPFVRRPLFVIIETDQPKLFEPFNPLSSTTPMLHLVGKNGNDLVGESFSLWLHNPLKALLCFCERKTIEKNSLSNALRALDDFCVRCVKCLVENEDRSFVRFLEDEFLHLFILRFVFAKLFFHHSVNENLKKCEPISFPSLSVQVISDEELKKHMYECAKALDVLTLLE